MARIFLTDCREGDVVSDVFIVTGKQLGTTKDGKLFIKTMIGDRTMQAPARMWNARRDAFEAMPDGGFIRVEGRTEKYQDNIQIIIDRFWPVEPQEKLSLEDLMPHTKKDVSAMFERLTDLLATIRSSPLAALVKAFTDDVELMDNLRRAPAAMAMHHAFLGGLLEHTLNAMEVGNVVCRFYPGLNRDLVLAGIFIHDLAKTWELNYMTSFGYTDGGQLVGHIAKAVVWLEDKSRIASMPIPREMLEVLQHIIVSHHGVPEFGAIKTPATPEAIAVHMIENMDAKLNMSLAACRWTSTGGGSFTEYQKAFGGRLFRPDVAPADLPEMDEPVPSQYPSADVPELKRIEVVAPQAIAIDKPALSNPAFEVTRR